MSFAYKYHMWLKECVIIINKKRRKINEKKILATLVQFIYYKKKVYHEKRFWIELIFQERHTHGFYYAIFPIMSLHESRFKNYFCMTATQFRKILLIASQITKQTIGLKNYLITLFDKYLQFSLCRFLASDDFMISISYQYLIDLITVSNIIDETYNSS
ncbi:hypothetical protein ACFW04_014012 [Cataglyphis niger]